MKLKLTMQNKNNFFHLKINYHVEQSLFLQCHVTSIMPDHSPLFVNLVIYLKIATTIAICFKFMFYIFIYPLLTFKLKLKPQNKKKGLSFLRKIAYLKSCSLLDLFPSTNVLLKINECYKMLLTR